MTTGERLVQLSPLNTGTAIQHLAAILVTQVMPEIGGSVNIETVRAVMADPKLLAGVLDNATVEGTISGEEKAKGSISKKTIR